jgi:hypothetical protein
MDKSNVQDVDIDCPEKLLTGTGKYYFNINEETGSVKGRINLNDDIARIVDFKNGEKIVATWCQEKRKLCIQIMKYQI